MKSETSSERIIVSFEIQRDEARSLNLRVVRRDTPDPTVTIAAEPLDKIDDEAYKAIWDRYSISSAYPSIPEQTIITSYKSACIDKLPNLQAASSTLLTRLKSLASELVSVEQTIYHLQAQISACDSLAAPIRRLPNELLLRVFHFCIPERKKPSPSSAPLLLTRVSRYWRHLALSDPTLYTRIRLDVPSKLQPPHLKWLSDTTTTFSSLAQQAPLALAVFAGGASGEMGPHTKLVPIVRDLVGRAKELYLGSPGPRWTKRFETFDVPAKSSNASSDEAVVAFPHLTHLYLNIKHPLWELRNGFGVFTSLTAPRLRSVELVVWNPVDLDHALALPSYPETSGGYRLPYASLTNLDLTLRVPHGTDLSSILSLWKGTLSLCPSLVRTSVHFQNHSVSPRVDLTDPNVHGVNVSAEYATLGGLKQMKIKTDFGGTLVSILSGLSLPALRTLVIDAIHPFTLTAPDDASPHATLSNLLLPNVQTLRLTRLSATTEALRAFFSLVGAKLVVLDLMLVASQTVGYGGGNIVLDTSTVLDLVSSDHRVLPHLRDLTLYYDRPGSTSVSTFSPGSTYPSNAGAGSVTLEMLTNAVSSSSGSARPHRPSQADLQANMSSLADALRPRLDRVFRETKPETRERENSDGLPTYPFRFTLVFPAKYRADLVVATGVLEGVGTRREYGDWYRTTVVDALERDIDHGGSFVDSVDPAYPL